MTSSAKVAHKPARNKHTEDKADTLLSLIDSFAEHKNKPALINFTKDDSLTISFNDFLNEIRHMAAGLQSQDIKKGDAVVLFAPNSPAWIISALAVIYSGATLVPIDSQQSDEVLKHIIKDSLADWIFTDERGSKRLEKVLSRSKSHHHTVRLDKNDDADSWKKIRGPIDKHSEPVIPTDIAVLFYTSGTTGMPKGVPLNHANMLPQLEAVAEMDLLQPKDRVLLPLPLFHVYPLNIGLLAPLKLGLPIILPYSLTGPEIMRAINKGRVTVVVSVPRLLRSLYQSISARFHKNPVVGAAFESVLAYCEGMDRMFNLRPGNILFAPLRKNFGPHLRMFTCGGAPLEADLALKLRAFGWEIAVGYGLTETSPLLTLRKPEDRDLDGMGTSIKGVEIKIEELKERDEQIDKDAGDILTRGANVFSGYRNRPDLNEEVFTDDGWFKTGDLGTLKNGKLHVIGRASSTIVMEGGEKIQPENIEDKISKQSGIAEIGLLQVEHKLVALIVPNRKTIAGKDEKAAVGSALKTASAGLASYLQVTDFAITHEPLPRTNLGKIKRHELKDRYDKAQAGTKDGKGGKSSSLNTDLSSDDQTLMEEPAAVSCLEWLKKKFPDQEITLDTSPQLDLNIDSLDWMTLTLELGEQQGVELSAEAISKVETVRDLLKEVASPTEGQGVAVSPLEDPKHYLNKHQKEYLKRLAPWQSALARNLYFLNRGAMSPFKVTAVGYERLTAKQYVFTPNHTSYIDAFAIAAALPYDRLCRTQWAGWSGIAFGNPIFSFFSRICRVFPIEAKQSLFASLALGVSVLKAGSNLIWFPEGERELDAKLLPFKEGIGLLLAKSDVEVVPVYLDGTRKSFPPGAFFPRFHHIRVIFGEPMTPSQLAKEGKGEKDSERIANALHDRVQALSKTKRSR